MKRFEPDFRNIVDAAKNIKPKRMPIYEHTISDKAKEIILNKKFGELYDGDLADKREYFRCYVDFFKKVGYDTVSFERCIGPVMPGSGALGKHKDGAIKNRSDFEKYPWDSIVDLFFQKYSDDFKLLSEVMPEGMKAIGGPGNGVFECTQDIVGYMGLCYISSDDTALYKDLFNKIGDIMFDIWKTFLEKYGDAYAVCRFGDDLGFRSATLISAQDIRKHIVPQYKRIISLIHSYNKPFLLHSCGNTFEIMDDLIDIANIDAKHSNEDSIAPFSVWVEKYGDRIGNFGGIDVDVLCNKKESELKEYVNDIIQNSINHGGFALGSGNSIPDYVPVDKYMTMIETARECRDE